MIIYFMVHYRSSAKLHYLAVRRAKVRFSFTFVVVQACARSSLAYVFFYYDYYYYFFL